MAVVAPGQKRSATIEALEDSETFCVIDGEFRRLRKEHAGVDQLVIDFLANEVRILNERVLETCTCRPRSGCSGGSRSSRRCTARNPLHLSAS